MLLVTLNIRIGKSIKTVEKFTDQVIRLADSVERISNPIKEGEVTTTRNWTSGGTPHTHTVTRNTGETIAAYDARCIAEFAKQFQQYPPD